MSAGMTAKFVVRFDRDQVVRLGRDLVQTLKMISAPCDDFVLLNAFAIRGLDVEAELAPAAVQVVCAQKGVILGRI
ncbi:MAG TPA: hypothetical protein VLN57_06520 [Xanthobacteraceae bacterium]|nr:hypothetical protein [Xanthobacteraceae bacterium]